MLLQRLVNLWPGAIHQHYLDTKAVQQSNVIDNTAKTGLDHGLTAQHHHKGFATVCIDIRGRLAESINKFSSTHALFVSFSKIAQQC